MGVDLQDVRSANARADAARARFKGALGFVKDRASPRRIKQDVVEDVKSRAIAVQSDARVALQRHPVAISSAVAAVLAVLFRKPLGKLVRTGWRRAKDITQRLERKRDV